MRRFEPEENKKNEMSGQCILVLKTSVLPLGLLKYTQDRALSKSMFVDITRDMTARSGCLSEVAADDDDVLSLVKHSHVQCRNISLPYLR